METEGHPCRTRLIIHIWPVIFCSSSNIPPWHSKGMVVYGVKSLDKVYKTNFKLLTLIYGVEALHKVYKAERHSPSNQLFDNNPQCVHIVQELYVWTMSHRTFRSSDQKYSMTIYSNYALTMQRILGLLTVVQSNSQIRICFSFDIMRTPFTLIRGFVVCNLVFVSCRTNP